MDDRQTGAARDWAEVNFDGLVGPTHNYAGLSYGNVASASNRGAASNPREGALQGLAKMRALIDMGLIQGVLPPHDRPHLKALRALGFTGSDRDMMVAAWKAEPALMSNLMSASAMWTANAATISPAPDTVDGRTHFTAANLTAMYHRSIEAETTARILRRLFPEGDRFAHHDPLPGGAYLGDEGAANHNRFAADYGAPGVALFVYGRRAFDQGAALRFPGRQTREASHAIARQHGVAPERAVFLQQNPEAINAGAFHNDVVAVSNRDVFFYHQHAFADPAAMRRTLQAAAGDAMTLRFVEVPADQVSLKDAVESYLFNSQLVSPPDADGMTLILPGEVMENPRTRAYVDGLVAGDGPITACRVMDVRQSMRNGGGPACLRLRVVLGAADRAAMGGAALMDDARITALEGWVKRHYRDRLAPEDLCDPALMEESFTALDELTGLLGLGSVYDFQR
ncbi:N-succinylarginine dihydrolase [Yunchengibacter salinarum]|uniref:N-succinylarginine dihydrolase n=1 Tax=Yunchengibacter salinarum TaxID=3133399 RepID=UPI0035B5F376